MTRLQSLLKKNKRRVIGSMSGTSCDGLDLAVVDIKGRGKNSRINVIYTFHVPYTQKQKEYLLDIITSKSMALKDLSQVNFYLAQIWANSIKKMLRRTRISAETIDMIGSHGHTFYHFPQDEKIIDHSVRSTLQLGDPAVLAQLTGITTVGDFRVSDMAVGGQGAPLVPYFDWILFSKYKKNIIALNIGGIANISFIPASGDRGKIIAFDTGPGNMLIDQLMQRLYELPFDRNGRIAKRGHFIPKLFSFLQSRDTYPAQKPPKSTGREHYGSEFVIDIIKKALRWRTPEPDVLNTITRYTAVTVFNAVKDYITDSVDEVVVSGGGSRNPVIMGMLQELFGKVPVKKSIEYGIDVDYKEAICFAVLANELLNGLPTNVKSVTGAHKEILLGKICPV
jgi:anhydro-N-acetylmuramic acid kinase